MHKSIAELLPKCIPTEHAWKLALLSAWPDIIGPINTAITIERIDHDSLLIGAPDNCWMQELYYLSDQLIEKINKKLDRPRIIKLRFKKNIQKTTRTALSKQHQNSSSTRHMTDVERDAINKVKDQGLATALKQFFYRCF